MTLSTSEKAWNDNHDNIFVVVVGLVKLVHIQLSRHASVKPTILNEHLLFWVSFLFHEFSYYREMNLKL
jgi:hypothetical protein